METGNVIDFGGSVSGGKARAKMSTCVKIWKFWFEMDILGCSVAGNNQPLL